jgi:non-heme Fe2+,alpha-ketoglutarate-dependent halogenase
MKTLSEGQVRDYHRDGFLSPIPVLTADEVAARMQDIERLEARIGCRISAAHKKYRSGSYTFLPWVDALCRHPKILDAVEDVIGPDILVYWGTFFVKEPGSPAYTDWHQDSTYFGLHPHEHVTAWVALTNASELAGCMEVVPANGAARQYHHAQGVLENSINAARQVIVEPVDERGVTPMPLRAGEMSLHNTLCLHRSAPNRADHRRIGFGISYIPAHLRCTGSHRMYAMLVRGQNKGNFDLLPAPASEFDPAGIEAGERFYARFFENYTQQIELHAAQFASRNGAAQPGTP